MYYFASVFVMAFVIGMIIMTKESIKDVEARKTFISFLVFITLFAILFIWAIK